jgi:hypothetical protein
MLVLSPAIMSESSPVSRLPLSSSMFAWGRSNNPTGTGPSSGGYLPRELAGSWRGRKSVSRRDSHESSNEMGHMSVQLLMSRRTSDWSYRWPTGRPGTTRHGPGEARPISQRTGPGIRAERAMPRETTCLTVGPGTSLWVTFRAGPAR